MAKAWADVVATPEFQQLPAERRQRARDLYFQQVVAPNLPSAKIERARMLFDRYRPEDAAPLASAGDAEMTGQQLSDEIVGGALGAPTPDVVSSIPEAIAQSARALPEQARLYAEGAGLAVEEGAARPLRALGAAMRSTRMPGPGGPLSLQQASQAAGARSDEESARRIGQVEAAQRDYQEALPVTEPWSAAGIASDVVQSAPATLASLGAGVVAGPAAGLGVMGASTAAREYGAARSEGRAPGAALEEAAARGGAEVAGEAIPLGFFIRQIRRLGKKEAGNALTRMTEGVVREGASEAVTEALNIAYETGRLDENMTLGDALNRIGYGATVGAVMGGTIQGSIETARAPIAASQALAARRLWKDIGASDPVADLVSTAAADRAFREGREVTAQDAVDAVDGVPDADLQAASRRYKVLRNEGGLSEQDAKELMKRDARKAAPAAQVQQPAASAAPRAPRQLDAAQRALDAAKSDAQASPQDPDAAARLDAAQRNFETIRAATQPDAAAEQQLFGDPDAQPAALVGGAGESRGDQPIRGGLDPDGVVPPGERQPGGSGTAAAPDAGVGPVEPVRNGEPEQQGALTQDAAGYRSLAQRERGNPDYFNADLAKELFPEYSQSRESRLAQSDAVQEQAATIRDAAFWERIEQPALPGEVVTFMAGGTGSGKTSAGPEEGIIYDTTLASPDSAIDKVRRVLDSGRLVEINYVATDPVEAFRRAIERSERAGRAVPLQTHINTHTGANESARRIADVYKDDPRVRVNVFDNAGGSARRVEGIPSFDYNALTERLHDVLDTALESGRITQAQYRAFGGAVPRQHRQGGRRDVPGAGSEVRSVPEQAGPPQAQDLVTEAPPPSGASASRRTKKSKASKPPGTIEQIGEDGRRRVRAIIRNAGGLSMRDIADITGERGRQMYRVAPGLFRKNGLGIDDIATRLHESGFITDAEYNDVDGGAERARELVQDAIRGLPVIHPEYFDLYNELRENDRLTARQVADALAVEPAALADLTFETETDSAADVLDFDLLDRIRQTDEAAFESAAVQYQNDDVALMEWAQEFVNERLREASEPGAGPDRSSPQDFGAPDQGTEPGESGERAGNGREARRDGEAQEVGFTLEREQDGQQQQAAGPASAAADRAENFSLTQQQRTEEQSAAETRASASAAQADMLGGQGQAAQEAADRQRQQRAQDAPAPSLGGGLFAQPQQNAQPAGKPKKKAAVTPQIASARQLDSFIAIAADSIKSLRASDVDRVINEAPRHFQQHLSSHIKKSRPDLTEEVDAVMAEINGDTPATPQIDANGITPDGRVVDAGMLPLNAIVETESGERFIVSYGRNGVLRGQSFTPGTRPDMSGDASVEFTTDEKSAGRFPNMRKDALFFRGQIYDGNWGEKAPNLTDELGGIFDEVLAEETEKLKPAPSKKKLTPRKKPKAVRAKRSAEEERAAYFMPGNIVRSYAGFDRVMAYRPETAESGWQVTVASAVKDGDGWKVDPNDQRLRQHSTQPSAADLKAGPVQRARGAGEALASAAKNTAAGLTSTIDAIGELFGGKGRLSSGLTFDEETYARAKPLFAQAIREYGAAATDVRDALRAIVRMVLDRFGPDVAQNMKPYAVRYIEDAIGGQRNDESAGSDLERNRGDAADQASDLASDDVDDAGRTAEGVRRDGGRDAEEGGDAGRGTIVHDGGAVAGGERGDQPVSASDRAELFAGIAPRTNDDPRGGGLGDSRAPVERSGDAQAQESAARPSEQRSKLEQQRAAESIPVKPGDKANIDATLPYLLAGQREDVKTAEDRFSKPDGYGMLFTNGTGTGKTFTGLGIVKRYQRQGKTNVIIVAPNDKIIEDWIKSGQALGLDITKLEDTNTAGDGIVITTYANYGQNEALASRNWDLVVHDEAHYLSQSQDGTHTNALDTLRAVTLNPDGALRRAEMLHGDLLREAHRIAKNNADLRKSDNYEQLGAPDEKAEAEAWAKWRAAQEEVREDVESRQGAQRPRVTFLSATPFAYRENVDWAQGYLFDWNEGQREGESRGYNGGSNRDRFFMTHFGYRMRYNKLTKPDAKVDVGLMERQFNAWLKKSGALSGRMLDVEADYDRKFVLIDSAVGRRIDDAMQWLRDQSRAHSKAAREGKGQQTADPYSLLLKLLDDQFDHLSRRYLLEAIKASAAVEHVREHMARGRKVVVFHDFKKGGGFNPFKFDAAVGASMSERLLEQERAAGRQGSAELTKMAEADKANRAALNRAIAEFNQRFSTLVQDLDKSFPSPIQVFTREFPGVLLFNGDVPPMKRRENVAKFNNDDNGPQVILVQSAAGKEGISLHDTTGKHQRVLLNLGLPTAPTTAIQQEGRIYRTGQASDAIQRYFNTGTNWEKWAFATTIASRASTAENLGMGEQARALRDAFIAAFEESDSFPAGHEGEGSGGKERDRSANDALTEFDRAKSFYFGTQKKNSRTKAQEGKDYFATPEPLGLKMAQWADARAGERMLEPSAGHGAIARWFREDADRTAIEPSGTLSAKLAMSFDGKVVADDFESHNVVNKYDTIVMNPPFGVGGKQAIEHLQKAVSHLREGGRVVAIIPTGPAADKRFDAWFYEQSERPVKALGSIFVNGEPTVIYKGDTVASRASWAPTGVVVGWRDGNPMVRADGEFRGATTMVSGESIKSVEPTGPRTEQYSAAEGLNLVADIKLPKITFERAGTQVSARVVVIDKGDAQGQSKIDLSSIDDIGEFFDRIEAIELPARTKPVEAEPEAEPARAQRPAKPKASDGPKLAPPPGGKHEIETYITKKGKTLRGVIRKDLTQEQAKAIDKYTWKLNGGYFIREEHLDQGGAAEFSLPDQRAGWDTLDGGGEIASSTTSDLRAALEEKFGKTGVGKLLDSGLVRIVQSQSDLPEHIRSAIERAGPAVAPRALYFRGNSRHPAQAFIIADRVSTEAAPGILLHEIGEHHGLKQMIGDKAYAELIERVKRGRKLDPAIRAAWSQVAQNYDHLTEGSEPFLREVIAHVAEGADLSKPGWLRDLIAKVRAFMWKLGLTKSTTEDIRALVVRSLRRSMKPEPGSVVFEPFGGEVAMSASSGRDLNFAREVLRELASRDEFFTYPRSQARSIQRAMSDISPEITFVGDMASDNESGENEFAHQWLFRTGKGQDFFVYESDDGRVWIDVSRLSEGDGGSAIYAAVGDYAFNTGQKFIGDPSGLTKVSVIRRTYNMLSSALRHGTTRHLGGSAEQARGNPEYGVKPLKFNGTDVENVNELIDTLVSYAERNVPEFGSMRFDFRQRKFTDSNGVPYSDADLAKLVERARDGEAKTGSRALKASVLVASLLRSASSQRPGLLEQVLRQPRELVDGTGALFSLPPTPPSGGVSRSAPGNRASWDAPEPSKLDNFLYELQDKQIDTKRVVQAIEASGKAIADSTDPYLQEELFHGRAAKGVQDFLSQELAPLLKRMALMRVSLADLETYLHNRHAEEANERVALINPEMPDGGSGILTADAKKYLAGLDPAMRKRLDSVADAVDKIVQRTRQMLVDYGLESQATVDAWGAAYDHYVPLHREDMDSGTGIGQGYSVRGPATKARVGSQRKVVDILANIAMQRERTITRGEKNRVAGSLIGLAKANPNADFWTVNVAPKVKELNPRTGQVEERIDPLYKSRPNVITARIPNQNGAIVEQFVVFNEFDERAMRMAEAIKNLDAGQLELGMAMAAKVTRYLASVNTQYNPIFGVVNLTRDAQGALLNLSTTPIAGKQKEVSKHVLPALRGIYIDARDTRAGRQPQSAWAQEWEEFQELGGQTGYRDMFKTSNERAEAIKRELGRITENKALGAGRAIFDWLSDYNLAMENAVRLAAFRVGKESGMTPERAASLAKNLTVNFNRKGRITRQAGALYAFFNASVQGTARLAETLNGPAGKRIITGALLLGVIQALALAAAGFDEEEPPYFVRERNLIIPIGDKKYITIPMPLGAHVLPNTSRVLTEFVLSGFKEPHKRVVQVVGSLLDAFNPVGNAGISMQTIAPTALDPFAALSENRDWSGRPIYREDFSSLDQTPGHSRAMNTASWLGVGLSRMLNWASGGDEYTPGMFSPTPDQIDYLFGQATGGVGREYTKAEQTITSLITGSDLPPYKVPLLGRFYGTSEGQAAQGGKFYANIRRMNAHQRAVEGRAKNDGDVAGYFEDHPEAHLFEQADAYYRAVSKLRKHRSELRDQGAPREDIKAIDDQITELMADFNSRVEESRKSSKR